MSTDLSTPAARDRAALAIWRDAYRQETGRHPDPALEERVREYLAERRSRGI